MRALIIGVTILIGWAASEVSADVKTIGNSELANLIVGKSVRFHGTTVIEYNLGGSFRQSNGTRLLFSGKWYLRGDHVCLEWKTSNSNSMNKRCDQYALIGGIYYKITERGFRISVSRIE